MILIAVALFAALSYAVTQSSRSGGKDISDEDAQLAASQIMQYGGYLSSTIERLKLINNCKDNQFDFSNSEWIRRLTLTQTIADNHNPNAPTDNRCDIFSAAGGNATALTFDNAGVHESLLNEAANTFAPGSGSIDIVRINEIGSNLPEIIMSTTVVSEKVCQEFNKMNDLGETIPNLVWEADEGATYNGDFSAVTEVWIGDTPETLPYVGAHAFCYNWYPSGWSSQGVKYVVQVLVAR